MSAENGSAQIEAGSSTVAALGTVVLDTPDPQGLAAFYGQILGWKVDPDSSADDWVTLRGAGGPALAFQLAPALVTPTWPEGPTPQQSHLDLFVTAFEDMEALVLGLGATVLDASEEHPTFRVYADPSGHPFCLCLKN